MTALAIIEGAGALIDSAREYVSHAKAAATVKAYRADWAQFAAWCDSAGLTALPAVPRTVALYIAAVADSGRKVSTIGRAMAAISKAHQAAGYESPASLRHAAVCETWQGIRRVKGVAPVQKAPLLTAALKDLLMALPDTLSGHRDRALLLLGFSAALRRSELVALDVSAVQTTRDGLVIALVRSKTDQEGIGRPIGVPYSADPSCCPVRALQTWLEAAGISEGPLFRQVDRHGRVKGRLTAQSVALIVKARSQAAGVKDTATLSGHSLRAGHATAAAMNGASERSIMNQTGHKSAAMVRRYIRDANIWRENSAMKLGL